MIINTVKMLICIRKKTDSCKLNTVIPKISLVDVFKELIIIDVIHKHAEINCKTIIPFSFNNSDMTVFTTHKLGINTFDMTHALNYYYNQCINNKYFKKEVDRFLKQMHKHFPKIASRGGVDNYLLYRHIGKD